MRHACVVNVPNACELRWRSGLPKGLHVQSSARALVMPLVCIQEEATRAGCKAGLASHNLAATVLTKAPRRKPLLAPLHC